MECIERRGEVCMCRRKRGVFREDRIGWLGQVVISKLRVVR